RGADVRSRAVARSITRATPDGTALIFRSLGVPARTHSRPAINALRHARSGARIATMSGWGKHQRAYKITADVHPLAHCPATDAKAGLPATTADAPHVPARRRR